MIPQVSVEVISEIAKKLADMSELIYKEKNSLLFEKEIKDLQQKQPYLSGWFSLYCQACEQQGMPLQDIAAMQAAFIAILKALYAQDEVSELGRMFGEDKV